LLYSCKAEQSVEQEQVNPETLMTEYSEDLSIQMSENGLKSYHFSTPLMEGYAMARDPYKEFRKGIKVVMYEDDSTANVSATMTSNYAIFYDNRKLWEAKGDVVVIQTNGRKLYTQQLFWNATTEKIYSNVDTKVLQKDGWHFGVGFEADESLKNIHFRKYSSEVEFDATPAPKKESENAKANETKAVEIKVESGDNKSDSKTEIELKSTSKSNEQTTNSRVGRDDVAPMQKVEGKASGVPQMKGHADKPNPTQPPGQGPGRPSRPHDGSNPKGVGAKGGDKRNQDVARPTMELSSGVTNPAMERSGEAVRPTMDRGSQLNLETDVPK
jgi:LPS export ABC transporter protein LptC